MAYRRFRRGGRRRFGRRRMFSRSRRRGKFRSRRLGPSYTVSRGGIRL